MDSTAYIPRPWWARQAQSVLYVIVYALMFCSGLAAVINLDFPAREAGWFVMAGALICVAGAAARLFFIELLGLWPLVFGLLVFVVWIQNQQGILTGWLVGACSGLLILRLLVLNLLAREAKREARDER